MYFDPSGVAEAPQILRHSERAMPPLCFQPAIDLCKCEMTLSLPRDSCDVAREPATVAIGIVAGVMTIRPTRNALIKRTY